MSAFWLYLESIYLFRFFGKIAWGPTNHIYFVFSERSHEDQPTTSCHGDSLDLARQPITLQKLKPFFQESYTYWGKLAFCHILFYHRLILILCHQFNLQQAHIIWPWEVGIGGRQGYIWPWGKYIHRRRFIITSQLISTNSARLNGVAMFPVLPIKIVDMAFVCWIAWFSSCFDAEVHNKK